MFLNILINFTLNRPLKNIKVMQNNHIINNNDYNISVTIKLQIHK